MFQSLKNKIQEETGKELRSALNYTAMRHQHTYQDGRLRSDRSSTYSVSSNNNDDSTTTSDNSQVDLVGKYRQQCQELNNQLNELQLRVETLQFENMRVEKANEILLETVKVAQTQKDLCCDELERMKNAQRTEFDKYKKLLAEKDSIALEYDRAIQYANDGDERCSNAWAAYRDLKNEMEKLSDTLQNVRQTSESEKCDFTSKLVALEEQTRHFKLRLQIIEEARATTLDFRKDDMGDQDSIVQERKLLERHLDEAHMELTNIKSTFSGQILALEMQVKHLTKQVTEEIEEKQKLQADVDCLKETLKRYETEESEVRVRYNKAIEKIMSLNTEIDELNYVLMTNKEENAQQLCEERTKMIFMKAKNTAMENKFQQDIESVRKELKESSDCCRELEKEIQDLQAEMKELRNKLLIEQNEKNVALLKNAEIQQSSDLLRQELREERNDRHELNERNQQLENENRSMKIELTEANGTLIELQDIMQKNQHKVNEFERLKDELYERNKTISLLNDRIGDLEKKTQTQNEFSNKQQTLPQSTLQYNNNRNTQTNQMMDEINFKYLKHVIFKFLTSREIEAIHLTKAVATLLYLTSDEEKLLEDTLKWKMSWFGTKPKHSTGQFTFSIPPPS